MRLQVRLEPVRRPDRRLGRLKPGLRLVQPRRVLELLKADLRDVDLLWVFSVWSALVVRSVGGGMWKWAEGVRSLATMYVDGVRVERRLTSGPC